MAKLVKQQVKPQITGADTIATFMEYIVTILCATIMILVPLYMKKAYYEIGQCKYDIYFGITVVGQPILIILALLSLFFRRRELSIKEIWKNLSGVDIAVGSYFLCALVSFGFCNYKEEAWSGYPGWNMGLYAQITFVLLYFFVSRYGRDYKAILTIFLGVSLIVVLLGVLNRFLIDPLGVYEGIPEYYHVQFLSTLGQTSWYSSFLCIALPIGMYVFWKSEEKKRSVIAGIYILLCFMSLVTQNSDSAFVAFIAILLVFTWFSCEEWKKLKKILEIGFLFGVSAKIVQGMSLFLDGSVIKELDRMSTVLITGKFTWILIAISFLFVLLISFGEKKINYPEKEIKVARNIIFVGLSIVILAAVIILCFSAKLASNSPLASIPYLVWSPQWGNGRGFTWQVSWKMLAEMDWLNKLFGVGPEGYPYYAYDNYKEVVDQMWQGSVLTNAHNEWLNAVINYGILGGAAYLGIFVSTIINCIKNVRHIPELIMILACTVAYIFHNFFCYQQVLCTPFIMILLGIVQYKIRENNKL